MIILKFSIEMILLLIWIVAASFAQSYQEEVLSTALCNRIYRILRV